MLKKLKWLLTAAVVLVIVVLLAAWAGLNAVVRKAVAAAATSGLQTQTTVGSATVSPLGGGVSLTDLAIASPPGFKSTNMFTLGKVGVSAGLGGIFGSPVKIDTVNVTSPQLVIEQSGGKLNVLALNEKLRGDGTAKPADAKAGSIKVVIGKLNLADAGVTILPGIPGADQKYEVKLPAVTLDNVGNADGNQNGEELSKVLNTIVATLAAKAAESDQVPGPVRQLLSLNVNQVADQLQGRAKAEIDKATDAIGSTLGGLLDRKKK